MLVTFFHSRNTSIWPSVHSLPCPYEPAQPSQDVSDLVCLNRPDPEPHLQGDVLGCPQPISSLTEMPNAWGCFWLSLCLPWALVSGGGLVTACESSVLPVPSRRPHSPQGALNPCCTLTASILRRSSLHCLINTNMLTTVFFQKSQFKIPLLRGFPPSKNCNATDAKITNFFQPQKKMEKHWK